ncbi:ewing's tumor-associated antigen 1 isoform X2 [Dunckerocampus dactyliophorus]|uniref:ewing's tumor-associated antigen 1 isoform X2 n=1 Tax=Dunckerocampus dactyliophorus TaxID=161453 RepID=UPI0024069B27|nr:ewing's tumor-associated antigen 1 isoform X2 [Dunckerocampus dactyliophorus]
MFDVMKGHRGTTGSLFEQAPKTKTNRLSRTLRQTQQTSTELDSPKADFKTPTRISRSRVSGTLSSESSYDSDVHHDIIWDATSPSPQRLGKRAKKHGAGVVSISDIVNRIAPKVCDISPLHTAAILLACLVVSCHKSSLQHGRPEVAEPTLQQWIGDSAAIPCTPDIQPPKNRRKSPRSNGVDDLLKLAKQFDLNLFHHDDDKEKEEEEMNQNQNQKTMQLLSEHESNSEDHLQNHMSSLCPIQKAGVELGHHTDLDFLFDEPTQHTSRVLSSFGSIHTTEKFPVTPRRVSPSAVDDWEDDDLLNDSLLVEMTQNPESFSVPKHCSTQKASCQVGALQPLPVICQSEGRRTFKLGSTSDFPTNFPSFQHLSSKAAGRDVSNKSHCPSYPATCNTSVSTASKKHSSPVPSHSDFLEDELDSIFSSELVWDDPADDELLCELCEDVENQIKRFSQNSRPPSQSSHRDPLKPTSRIWEPQNQKASNHVPGICGSTPPATANGQVKDYSGSSQATSSSMLSQVITMTTASALTLPRHGGPAHQFSFKRPSNPVSMVTNKVAAECSAAEIELKKQQALERRRRRLQEVRDLKEPRKGVTWPV